MDIKPIKNERDYHRVLKQIDSLMDAKANTRAGNKLDVLVTLAEAWEEKHYPIDSPDQVAAIEFPQLEDKLNLLGKIAKRFSRGSAEAKVIQLAAEALFYVSCKETRAEFAEFLLENKKPLTPAQILHLRAMGIDPNAPIKPRRRRSKKTGHSKGHS